MKRDHHLLRLHSSDHHLCNDQQWCKPNQNDNDMDELLAVLGYKVRTSNMAEVAQKLEKLEEAMDSAQEQSLTHLTSDAVHHNPSDIQSWIETMISELDDDDDCDLKAIPGKAVFPGSKRFKPDTPVEPGPVQPDPVHPLLLEENGIRLVHSLTACAEEVQRENLEFAAVLVKQIGLLAAAQGGAMGKVAIFFAEALARRIYGVCPQKPLDFSNAFYDVSPCLKFAHFTANQAILDSFEGKSAVHVVDFGMNEGIQWPALMQALSIRSGGAPSFRVTSIGVTEPDRDVGVRLGRFAEAIKIDFSFREIRVSKLEEMNAEFVGIGAHEAVAVNSVFELHTLLARFGSLEKFLAEVRKMKPAIFTVVEQEASHDSPVFLDRFMEALHYYSTLFDSLEGSESSGSAMAEVYLGQQICNIVACEGDDRVERHEPLARWRTRFGSAGFVPVHLGSDAFKQASMLLDVFEGRDGYRVEEDEGCLMLAWHTRPLIATSAWRPARLA